MDVATLITRYQSGKRDFSWASLPQADLSGASLAEINLYRADLSGANLQGANLAKANLFKANLAGANLMGANLTGANLRKADLREAQCEADTLHGADWHGALLPDSLAEILTQANDEGSAETWPPSTHAPHVDEPEPVENRPDAAVSPWQRSAALPSPPDSLPTHSLPTHSSRSDPMARREIVISMAHLGFGLFCFGLILGDAQAPWPTGVLVWLALPLGLWKEDLAWYVPIAGAVAVLLGVGLSLAVMIFMGPVLVGLLISFAIYGNIMTWRLTQAIGTALWFGGLMLILMHTATWLFDGSDAYGGGGIVINLALFQVGLLLIIGTIALGRGALGYLQLNEGFYPRMRQWQYVGGSGAVGMLLGMALGWP